MNDDDHDKNKLEHAFLKTVLSDKFAMKVASDRMEFFCDNNFSVHDMLKSVDDYRKEASEYPDGGKQKGILEDVIEILEVLINQKNKRATNLTFVNFESTKNSS